jgi:anion-transporting  ArsA/GET3 family ATPase
MRGPCSRSSRLTYPMTDLFKLRFVTVVGKGGVGKTTLSAAFALAAARRGKRVLIAMCNAKERISDLLEVAPIGPKNQPVLPGIEAVNIIPKYALEEYGVMVLRVRALYKAIFENRLVAAFLHGTPGIEAWSILGKAQFHAHEMEGGRPRYDLVILDAPATGHGLEMLRVPRVLLDVAPPGLLRREAERAWELLSDPVRSGVLLVTLPEDMPVNESIELHAALTQELRLPMAAVAVNGLVPRLFEPAEGEWVTRECNASQADQLVHSLLLAGRRRFARERLQAEAVARLSREIPLPQIKLPQMVVSELKRREIEELSKSFD